jgi:hypothetical protein
MASMDPAPTILKVMLLQTVSIERGGYRTWAAIAENHQLSVRLHSLKGEIKKVEHLNLDVKHTFHTYWKRLLILCPIEAGATK